jgi:hypothetical protein
MLLGVVAICGVLGGACVDRPASAMPGSSLRPRAAMARDSVRIEYLCGNEFRVMHYDTASVYVTWDVAESADTAGHDWLPGRVRGFPFISLIFTASSKGTFRLFAKGRLLGTMANGGKPCPPNPLAMLDSMMPESWRKMSDTAKSMSILAMAAMLNDPLVKFGPLGPLKGAARVFYDSLVAGNEAMMDSATANLGYQRLACLERRAYQTFGHDSVARISAAAERAVQARHTRAEWAAGDKGIATIQDAPDDTFCQRVDSLWYAMASKARKARK